MVKVQSIKIESITDDNKHIVASLIADTKEDVIACGTSGANIVGLTAEHILTLGSTAFCADSNFGILDSNGNWNW